MLPIWKPYYFTPGATGSTYDYAIAVDGSEVFAGTAYRRPDGVLRIRLDDIAATFLGNPWPGVTSGDHTAAGLRVTAAVLDDEGAPEISEEFVIDRTHQVLTQPAFRGLPITGRYVDGMAVPVTHIGTFQVFNGTTAVTIPDADGNYIIASPADFIEVGQDVTFEKVDRCGENFALYYLNELGGWDFLLMEGRCSRTYTYQRNTLRQTADADGRTVREYGNNAQRVYELRTGWLTDEQAAMMHNLIGSTEAVLWTSTEGYIPVVIRETECPFKTQDGEGRGIVQYVISVEAAEDFRR